MSNSRFSKLLQMLEEQPDDLFLLYALGMEYRGIGQYGEAVQQFERIILKDPSYVPAYYQLGQLLSETDEARAIGLFEKGMGLARVNGDFKTMNEFRSALDELLY